MIKKSMALLLPILIPLLLVVSVNEYYRIKLNKQHYFRSKIISINSSNAYIDKCSWQCHDNTSYCKTHHVKLLNRYFPYVDQLYFGIIDLLKMPGNYVMANIVFLVILWPALMYYFFVRTIFMQIKIAELKKSKNG